jgi:hypothetical protein
MFIKTKETHPANLRLHVQIDKRNILMAGHYKSIDGWALQKYHPDGWALQKPFKHRSSLPSLE